MEAKEAIRRIKIHFMIHNDGRPTPHLDKAVAFAIESCEKQIPKKLEVWANGTYHCPCCDKDNTYLNFPVCVECGQLLDWE